MKIRPILLDQDIQSVTNLTDQLGYPSSQIDLYQRLKNIHQEPNYHTFVVEYSGQVIAYTGFIQLKTWEFEGDFLRIQVFVVDKSFRGQGIGKLLLKAVEDFAKQHQISRILLNSSNREERKVAHQFYKNLGFEAKSTGFNKSIEL